MINLAIREWVLNLAKEDHEGAIWALDKIANTVSLGRIQEVCQELREHLESRPIPQERGDVLLYSQEREINGNDDKHEASNEVLGEQ